MNWLTHDRRVWLMALGAGLPGTSIALILLWGGDFSSKVQWTLTLFIVGLWWGVSVALRDRVVYPLQTLSNLLAALREEDFSIRARGQRRNDPLGEVLLEMNALADTLREQRLGALESGRLPSHHDRESGITSALNAAAYRTIEKIGAFVFKC